MVSRTEWVAMGAMVYAGTLGRLGARRGGDEREEAMGSLLGAKARAARRMGSEVEERSAVVEEQAAGAAATPDPAAAPGRQRYEGPARTMPTVVGAASVTPPPAAGAAPGARPEIEMAAPQAEVTAPAAAVSTSPSATPGPEPAAAAPPPKAPEAPPPSTPSVIWNRPVPGVTPSAPAGHGQATKPESPTAESAPETPAGEDVADATGRLLRAKRRARDKQE